MSEECEVQFVKKRRNAEEQAHGIILYLAVPERPIIPQLDSWQVNYRFH